jgi:protein mago nashi
VQVTESRDADGLRIFYYLVQDLKTMAISIMNAHFRINPYST